MRKRLRAALILVAGLAITLGGLLAPAAVAKTGIVPGPGYVQISTPGPLSQIDVGADTTMQVVDSRASGAGEFHYPQTSCTADLGVYVTVGATVYGPNPMAPWHCAASNLNPNIPDIPGTAIKIKVSNWQLLKND